MDTVILTEVFKEYGFDPGKVTCVPFGNGLINQTWKLIDGDSEFIIQKMNTAIFKNPLAIADNITVISAYLLETQQDYYFVEPVENEEGFSFYDTGKEVFRVFPFVKNSHTIDVVSTAGQAYEAARQFGLFTKVLSGLDVTQLNITLPDFHNLSLRYARFESALKDGNTERIEQSRTLIQDILQYKIIVDEFEAIKQNTAFKLRVTHHDTKISNVLFDKQDKGICVIDLDTVMAGYFISDLGDMLRTYLSPVSEEEKVLSKIEIRKDIYHAIIDGYLSEMNDELTPTEKKHFDYAGKFMIYMQALRFLTDHLNNDVYYGAKYEGHNFVRASNQMTLLKKFVEFEND